MKIWRFSIQSHCFWFGFVAGKFKTKLVKEWVEKLYQDRSKSSGTWRKEAENTCRVCVVCLCSRLFVLWRGRRGTCITRHYLYKTKFLNFYLEDWCVILSRHSFSYNLHQSLNVYFLIYLKCTSWISSYMYIISFICL